MKIEPYKLYTVKEVSQYLGYSLYIVRKGLRSLKTKDPMAWAVKAKPLKVGGEFRFLGINIINIFN